MPRINKILEVYLSLNESLVGDDKIVWLSSFYDTPKFLILDCYWKTLN